MVYNNKFITVIKCKGKVLREFSDGTVRLPFGSDYSILLKNKDTRKALVEVFVDGKDVLDGNNIIVGPNETTELKGFMKDSTVRNKFRFINKTKEISKYRGDLLEDGLVEVKYRFEEYKPVTIGWQLPKGYRGIEFGDIPRACCSNDSSLNSRDVYYKSFNTSSYINEDGITVPGAETVQNFTAGSIGALESICYNIILRLKGKVAKDKVSKAVTVKKKLICPTCGRRWDSSLKYCGNCSTYLH